MKVVLTGEGSDELFAGRALHSFPLQLNLSSSVHRTTHLNSSYVLELLKLSFDVDECEPLFAGYLYFRDAPDSPAIHKVGRCRLTLSNPR